jgi:hypothetical protein
VASRYRTYLNAELRRKGKIPSMIIPDDILLAMKNGVDLALSRLARENQEDQNKYGQEATLVCDLCVGFKNHFGEKADCHLEVLYPNPGEQKRIDARLTLFRGTSEAQTIAVEAKCELSYDNLTLGFRDSCVDATRLISLSDDLKTIIYLADYRLLTENSKSTSEKRAARCRQVLEYLNSDIEFNMKDYIKRAKQYAWDDKNEERLFSSLLSQNSNIMFVPIFRKLDPSKRFCIAVYKIVDDEG